MSRKRVVSREINPLLATLPEKFSDIHDWQIDAVTEIVEAFDQGIRVVVLDAPTGSGKTLIAEIVRRELETRACYVCHNKDLQAQFAGDFDYSKVLFGRDNYLPVHKQYNATCGDCTARGESACVLCPSVSSCPYQLAKGAAVKSVVPVLNSAYWLNETQGVKSRFKNTGLAILDECDTLEQVLMGQVEVYVSDRSQQKYGINPPRKLTVASEFLPWCEHALERVSKPLEKLINIDFASVQQVRELKRLVNLQSNIVAMKADLELEVPWVYTGGAGSSKRRGDEISFKPVKVDRFGESRIWSKDKRFLLMSGSVISAEQLLSSLGWTGDYKAVSVESQFHPKNRQVVVKPVADVTKRGLDERQFGLLRDSLTSILQQHSGQRVVVHSVSYSLGKRIVDELRRCDSIRGRIVTYGGGDGRAAAIAHYRATPDAVIIAPSLDRGLDLPGDLCRVQVVLKLPFGSLGDKQVSERLYNTPDGKIWYNVEVARTIIQMVGRGVRSESDYCTCYVLDATFVKWYRAWGHLLPKWFRKGIRVEYAD